MSDLTKWRCILLTIVAAVCFHYGYEITGLIMIFLLVCEL